jgi:hypothetical protein
MLFDFYYLSQNLFQMQISKRQIAFLSVFAMLLYLVPNLVQDLHRVWGHPDFQAVNTAQNGIQFHQQSEKCPVCVFEFNVVDRLENTVFIPSLKTESFLFNPKQQDQIPNNTFDYNNLRGPPIV